MFSARSIGLMGVCACIVIDAPPVFGLQDPVPRSIRAIAADSSNQQQTQRRRRRRRSASSSNVGYIDNAIVDNQFQIRYDFANNIDRPDRSEFIYAKCGCYREAGLDPAAPGPARSFSGIDPAVVPVIENDVTYHEVVLDVEYAPHERFSLFAEVPFRFLDLQTLGNQRGIGDIRAGFKAAAVAGGDRYLTVQFGTYLPTGDPANGLGTDHVSLEPALLYHEGGAQPFAFEAEVRLWMPIDPSSGMGTGPALESSDFAAPIIRYGVGFGYNLTSTGPVRFSPVVEVVGWTLTGGIATRADDGTVSTLIIEDAGGETILNAKLGARIGVGPSDLFIGYGRGLTDQVWYKNVVRFEYRIMWGANE